MLFDPSIWGPHYWFFIHTIAHSYPLTPNSVTKRKYYDLMQNMPIFIPNVDIGDRFAQMLDKYPVAPYLDSRESFIRWTHFIHNKINALLGKEEISYLASLEQYNAQYKPKSISISEKLKISKQQLYLFFILTCLALLYMYY